MDKRLIGRYNINYILRFPGFKMRIICAAHHFPRKYPLSSTALNIWVRYFIPIIDNSLRILPVKRS
jgi:hypothetical protein